MSFASYTHAIASPTPPRDLLAAWASWTLTGFPSPASPCLDQPLRHLSSNFANTQIHFSLLGFETSYGSSLPSSTIQTTQQSLGDPGLVALATPPTLSSGDWVELNQMVPTLPATPWCPMSSCGCTCSVHTLSGTPPSPTPTLELPLAC